MGTTATPRVVIAHRPTEWEQLVRRHGTIGQARFFLASRDQDPETLVERHEQLEHVLSSVDASTPTSWRRARVTREHFAGFLFEPNDIVVAVGQDGLVPNLAKYLSGQPVIGVNPSPERNEGLLVRFDPTDIAAVLHGVRANELPVEERTMVSARLDDGQQLLALNEIFIGHSTHQSARYTIRHDDRAEQQSSSGIIVASGTGSTGWARSIAAATHSRLGLPSPVERSAAFFVREAWPSVSTSADLVEGLCTQESPLRIVSQMDDGGTAFGDGVETDRLDIGWGQELVVAPAEQQLRLVVP